MIKKAKSASSGSESESAPKKMPAAAAKKSMGASSASDSESAPKKMPVAAAAKKSSVASACDCNKIISDTDDLIKRTRAASCHPPVEAPVKDCCEECNTYQKLSKAVDTTNLSDCVEQAEKAAARPHEHPLKAELCKEEKCPNKCLSKLLDTNCLTKKVEAVEKVAD